MTKALIIPEEFSLAQAQFMASVFQASQLGRDEIMSFEEREVHMDLNHRQGCEKVLAKCCDIDEDDNLRIKESFIKEV